MMINPRVMPLNFVNKEKREYAFQIAHFVNAANWKLDCDKEVLREFLGVYLDNFLNQICDHLAVIRFDLDDFHIGMIASHEDLASKDFEGVGNKPSFFTSEETGYTHIYFTPQEDELSDAMVSIMNDYLDWKYAYRGTKNGVHEWVIENKSVRDFEDNFTYAWSTPELIHFTYEVF